MKFELSELSGLLAGSLFAVFGSIYCAGSVISYCLRSVIP